MGRNAFRACIDLRGGLPPGGKIREDLCGYFPMFRKALNDG